MIDGPRDRRSPPPRGFFCAWVAGRGWLGIARILKWST
ncbi:hypothetical protein RB1999 [Rhodopirellula baltica SH 1]|uniref:Uncharacterized protein n=1 Tax=Rhodopirellula baltica (strain DSM 10527 / NCIMB 13988 / SH1) TaxID=243090 RepID=Q7UWJ6_RHOBA|nr:hypothetical protein RB1999 [Rhodopirellula baltica SH 1]